jgi:hypothetical protein
MIIFDISTNTFIIWNSFIRFYWERHFKHKVHTYVCGTVQADVTEWKT